MACQGYEEWDAIIEFIHSSNLDLSNFNYWDLAVQFNEGVDLPCPLDCGAICKEYAPHSSKLPGHCCDRCEHIFTGIDFTECSAGHNIEEWFDLVEDYKYKRFKQW